MPRTTMTIPERLLDRLRQLAARRRTSIAALVREAIEVKVSQDRPRPRSPGMGASGRSNTARRAGDERPEPRAWR